MRCNTVFSAPFMVIILLIVSRGVGAIPIQQNVVDNYVQLNHFGPVGQSFIAEYSQVSATVWISDYNQQVDPSDFEISYDVYEGTGTAGLLVGSGEFSVPTDGYLGWATLNLSEYVLQIGDTYSIMLNNGNARWSIGFSETDSYAGGQMILSQDPHNLFPDYSQYDLAFQLDSVSVTEPSGVFLMLIAIFSYRRRHHVS